MRRFLLSYLTLLALLPAAKIQFEHPPATDIVAIDILIEPDSIMIQRAQAANQRLRHDDPTGFALDTTHRPHITLLQRFVRNRDLDRIANALNDTIAGLHPFPMNLTATDYFSSLFAGNGMLFYRIAPAPILKELQTRIVQAVQPFAVPSGGQSAFARLPGESVNDATIRWVRNFVPNASGKNYQPHVTIGVAHPAFLEIIKREHFQPFKFQGLRIAIAQLGNFGTARRKLWESGVPQRLRDNR